MSRWKVVFKLGEYTCTADVSAETEEEALREIENIPRNHLDDLEVVSVKNMGEYPYKETR